MLNEIRIIYCTKMIYKDQTRHLLLSTLNDIQVCVIISREHPECLDFENSSGDNAHNPETVDAIKETEKVSIVTGFDQFQLIPRDAAGKPKLSGLEIFEHAC